MSPTLLSMALFASPIKSSEKVPPPTQVQKADLAASSIRAPFRKFCHSTPSLPLFKPKGIYVGELQEKWQFPSDHLPIGMTFDNLHILSWNVLDAAHMGWVTEKNSQGLSRSMIADEHVYIGSSGLTLRDCHIADLLLEMIQHPTHPRSLLSLQECSAPFLTELRAKLPPYFEIVSSHGEAFLFDRRLFEVVEAKEVSGLFRESPDTTFQDITLRRLDNKELYRFLNVHLPGDPVQPGRFEFAQYLKDTFDPSLKTVAMGDMNFNELEMKEAVKRAFLEPSPFSLYSPYCTNISPYLFHSKAIDHFIVYSPDPSPVVLSLPEEISPSLGPIVALLEGQKTP